MFTHFSALQESQLQNVERSAFLLDQGMMFYTSFIIAIFGLIYLFYSQKDKQLWLFSMSALIVIISLLIMNGKSYYTAGVYPFLIAAGSVYIGSKLKTRWKKILLIACIIILVVPIVPLGIPIMPPKKLVSYFDKLENIGIDIGRVHEDGNKYPLPQDFADMMGWKDIAALAKVAYDSVDDKKACVIFGDNYGIAGAVALINKKI